MVKKHKKYSLNSFHDSIITTNNIKNNINYSKEHEEYYTEKEIVLKDGFVSFVSIENEVVFISYKKIIENKIWFLEKLYEFSQHTGTEFRKVDFSTKKLEEIKHFVENLEWVIEGDKVNFKAELEEIAMLTCDDMYNTRNEVNIIYKSNDEDDYDCECDCDIYEGYNDYDNYNYHNDDYNNDDDYSDDNYYENNSIDKSEYGLNNY